MTTAAYLSKAEQKVLVLEKHLEIGGGLATERSRLWLSPQHSLYLSYDDGICPRIRILTL